ncbi:DnaJ domain-containing protein [Cadophora sp. MPI-SDFR-AT-0126]|nr:DnaJ domain-containing protein [Leotiomycetes sp. MPI-SDFR-AT-0126]
MAPVKITDDYYFLLEVQQTATLEVITKSYRRLALVLHPDRNPRSNATEAFQLLGRAYETLKDASLRQSYDLLYPSIKSRQPGTEHVPPQTQPDFSSRSSAQPSQSTQKPTQEDISDLAAIAALRRTKQERDVKWRFAAKGYDNAIFEIQREVARLKKAIEDLESIRKAEEAEEAAAKSWSTWILSPLYKKPFESDEDKANKANARLQRLHTKNFKERALDLKMVQLRKWQKELEDGRQTFEKADETDDRNIATYESRLRQRQARLRHEKMQEERFARERAQRAEQEKREKEQRERDRIEREEREKQRKAAEEYWTKYQTELREEDERKNRARKAREATQNCRNYEQSSANQQGRQGGAQGKTASSSSGHFKPPNSHAPPSKSGSGTSTCRHGAWWPKVDAATPRGRLSCEECSAEYSYLLQCPGCKKKACAACRQKLKPINKGRPKTENSRGNQQRSKSAHTRG